MPDIFDEARRSPVLYKIGVFPNGQPRYVRAPMNILKIPSVPNGQMETYISTHSNMADGPGLYLTEDDNPASIADRDGIGFLSGEVLTEEHICGAGDRDELLSFHRLAPL